MSLLTALTLASFVAAPVPKDLPKSESVEGEWKVTQLLHGGVPHSPEQPKSAVIKGNTMTVKDGPRDEEAFTITLDPKATPATIDIRPLRDGKPGNGPVIQGIYLLEKDKLTICFSTGGDRPKEFKSENGSNVGLLVLERAKK